MPKENELEDTLESPPEEEETSVNPGETPEEPQRKQALPEKPDEQAGDLVEKNKRLFARLMKSEERRKEAEVKLTEAEKKAHPMDDLTKIAEAGMAFEGLDARERAKLIEEAKIKDKALIETRKDEDFVLWQTAYKEKVEKEKTPEPSTKQTIDATSSKARVERFKKGELSKKEQEEFLREIGVVRQYGPPPPPKRTE